MQYEVKWIHGWQLWLNCEQDHKLKWIYLAEETGFWSCQTGSEKNPKWNPTGDKNDSLLPGCDSQPKPASLIGKEENLTQHYRVPDWLLWNLGECGGYIFLSPTFSLEWMCVVLAGGSDIMAVKASSGSSLPATSFWLPLPVFHTAP